MTFCELSWNCEKWIYCWLNIQNQALKHWTDKSKQNAALCNDWHNRFARNCLVSKSDLSFSPSKMSPGSHQAIIKQSPGSHWVIVQSLLSHQIASLKLYQELWKPSNKKVARQNQFKMQLCVMIGTTDSHAIVSYQNLICRFHRQKCLCNCRVSLFLEKNFAQIVYVHNLNVYQTWCFYFYIFRRLSVW